MSCSEYKFRDWMPNEIRLVEELAKRHLMPHQIAREMPGRTEKAIMNYCAAHNIPLADDQLIRRNCLSCTRSFTTMSRFIRICTKCKDKVERQGIDAL